MFCSLWTFSSTVTVDTQPPSLVEPALSYRVGSGATQPITPGLTLRQTTLFPDEPGTRLTLRLKTPTMFTLQLRHTHWVAAGAMTVSVRGQAGVSPEHLNFVCLDLNSNEVRLIAPEPLPFRPRR